MKITITHILVPSLAVGLGVLWLYIRNSIARLKMASAYKAKTLCSAAFISGRDIKSGHIEDVTAGPLGFLEKLPTKIDRVARSVTVSCFGIMPSTAVFREGIGATLALGVTPRELLSEKSPISTSPPGDSGGLWTEGERVDISLIPSGINEEKLRSVVASAFLGPAFQEKENPLRTRAVVVVYDGRIVAEQYAPGFAAEMPLGGWSMAKGVVNALVGILVRDGRLRLDDDCLLREWSAPGDPRRAITLDNLLRMSSGLEFTENYSAKPDGDISMMLFRSGDASGFSAAKPLTHPPGTFFQYSSGTSNILCRIIRDKIGDDSDYHAFPYRELFHRIGVRSALLERDATGTFIGSSFLYATARDWAKIGLLFGGDGVWNGERILPEGWVDYSRTPAPADPSREHGAHFRLKFPVGEQRPDLPSDIFHMSGHEGQFVSILPREKLVVVRLGFTQDKEAWDQERFVADLLQTLPRADSG